ncbi:MAG: 6,7-dimethyl-8-ribityllumazine synthase [Pseudomonadota bacterium]|nr:6,7-dimethyl-8-ribityllumazine synthase [Pseudomonadota bacterium]
MTTIEGGLRVTGARFGIVVARFNDFITERLLGAAVDTLLRSGARQTDLTIVKVPGAFELPLAAARLAARQQIDGVVALGCVIRGATPHFDYVCAEAAKGLTRVALDSGKPVGFGLLTVNNIEQAIERAGTKAGNKGADAALSVVEMVDLMGKLSE